MKKLITIVTIAVVSFNFVSCRQEDDNTDFNTPSQQEKMAFAKGGNAVKTDTVQASQKPPVDPDPPVKDGTSW